MNPQELRLNNWILDPTGTPRKVDYIGDTIGLLNDTGGTDKYQVDPIYSGDITQLKGVPLTVETLGKCGFQIRFRYSFWSFQNASGFIISMWMEDEPCAGFEKKGYCYYGELYTELAFVHQLQNLYYSLTGQELTINL